MSCTAELGEGRETRVGGRLGLRLRAAARVATASFGSRLRGAGAPLGIKAGKAVVMPLLLVALAAGTAFAGGKDDARGFVISITLLPLALFPLGLAWNLLALMIAPIRSEDLALDINEHRWKTLFLGLANIVALLVLFGAFEKRVPLLAGLVFLTFISLALAGAHGAARAVGETLLERAGVISGSPLKALAIGWFVVVYVSCVPVIGWFIGAVWLLRGVGGVILQVAGKRSKDPGFAAEA